jgi:hypothetical protein
VPKSREFYRSVCAVGGQSGKFAASRLRGHQRPQFMRLSCALIIQGTGRNTMYRRSILGISAMTMLGLALASSSAVSQQKSLKEQIVGTWTYASADTVRPDGSRVPTWGPNPAGLWMFGSDGRYM